MALRFEKIIRGYTVTIHADRFREEPDAGIHRWEPEEVWARTDDGSNFPLTEEEERECLHQATLYHLTHLLRIFPREYSR